MLSALLCNRASMLSPRSDLGQKLVTSEGGWGTGLQCRTWIMNADVCCTGIVWEEAVLAPAALSICKGVYSSRVDVHNTRPRRPFRCNFSLLVCKGIDHPHKDFIALP